MTWRDFPTTYNEEPPLHGPVWNNPNVGVTGERKPNYVTVTDSEGKTYTLVGAAADEYRTAHPGFGGAEAGSMPPGI